MTARTAMRTAGLLAGAALASYAVRRARQLDLPGRTALIVGGSRGLGLLIARELGLQGVRVTLAARDAAELDAARADLIARRIDASVRVCDVSDRAEAGALVDAVVAQYGGLDILINNAGVIQVGPLEHMQTADFEQAMAVHFWGPLQTCPPPFRSCAGRAAATS